MIVEIEFFKGDTILCGKKISFLQFKRRIGTVENMYDRQEDNFIELFCRLYGYEIVISNLVPDYIYDRDTKCFTNHFK